MGIDETTFPIDGKTGWMWVARSKTESYYTLEYSRGSKILKKHLKEFSGILVSDGYAPYRTVFCNNKKQRCTAHLQRDANIWQENQMINMLKSFTGNSQNYCIVQEFGV